MASKSKAKRRWSGRERERGRGRDGGRVGRRSKNNNDIWKREQQNLKVGAFMHRKLGAQ